AAPYQVFAAQDANMTIAAGNERQWQRLCQELGLEELGADPRFATNADRARHQGELAVLVDAKLQAHPRDTWIERLSAAGVPCGPVNSLAQALDDPALTERGLVFGYDHPTAGPQQAIGNPINIRGHDAPERRPPL